jgi:hypothetical protein
VFVIDRDGAILPAGGPLTSHRKGVARKASAP